ncbi:glycosyltransferase family 2 protein [Marimonas lutisalis]|uniref:glycosyltransferase family 2 protein n=1 Tax=Marimonas lutisalis TaxID=2545756 RepID=UPI0010F56E66|nr:glycosyltransferase [Marimonas lutisalis]
MTATSFHRFEGRPAIAGLCSIVCTTCNHAQFSAAAIESIAAQDYWPIEIIVVDDGSNDDKAQIVRVALESAQVPYRKEL